MEYYASHPLTSRTLDLSSARSHIDTILQEQELEQKVIGTELIRWIQLTITLIFCLFLLIFSINLSMPYEIVIIPLIIYDLFLIIQIIMQRKNQSSMIFLKRNIKEFAEHLGNIIFKFGIIVYLSYRDTSFLLISTPIFVATAIRWIFKPKYSVECQAFSAIIRLIVRTLKLLAILSIGLKLDHNVSWSWITTFWPIWLGSSILAIIGLGMILLLISSICSFISGQGSYIDIVSSSWLLFVTWTSSLSLFYFFYFLGLSLDDGDWSQMIAPNVVVILVLILLVILTKSCFQSLKIWWQDFFSNQDEDINHIQGAIHDINSPTQTVTEQIISILKKPPKFLVRVSNTYYKPCDDAKVTPTTPRHKKSKSEMVGRNQAPAETVETEQKYTNVSMVDASIHQSIDFSSGSTQKVCMICCNEEPNAVIMDCGHGGLCYSCSIELWKVQKCCHICRREISQVLEISKAKSKILNVVSVTGVVYEDNSD